MKVRVCPNCGKHNPDNAWNCQECGATLSIDTLTDLAENQPRQSAKLNIDGGVNNAISTSDVSQTKEDAKVIIACENCGQKLRVPLRKKNLHVACPACHHEFNYEFVEATVINDTPVNKQSVSPQVAKPSRTTNAIPSQPQQRICPKCGWYKVEFAPDFNDGLIYLTFGLWLIVMALTAALGSPIYNPPYKCKICGYEWRD